MTLDAATQAIVSAAESSGAPKLHEMPIHEARAAAGQMSALCSTNLTVAEVRDVTVDVADGTAITVRLIDPGHTKHAVIVHYHGGGWTVGSIDALEVFGRALAAQTGCVVALASYRLAPEHRFPVAVDDAWDALCWVAANVAAAGDRQLPLIVAGDSAGGNLAAVMAQRAVQRGGPALAAQLLICPVTDSDTKRPSYLDPANQLAVFDREMMEWFWDMYLPESGRRGDPEASPLRATDLRGLPPAVVVTAEHDVLRDEGEAYAGRLRDAGVPVSQHRFAGQMHDFVTMVGFLPGSDDGLDYVAHEIEGLLPGAQQTGGLS